MRFLRPAGLIPLASGLWVIDEFQPVAAIIDPRSGEVRDVVGWPELPTAPAVYGWPGPAVLGDGTSVWSQQHRSGPVVRIGPEGVAAAVWTDGLQLAVCGPGEAWCAPAPLDQQIVHGDAQPQTLGDGGRFRLLRVQPDGRQHFMTIDRPVRALHATPHALVIQVDDDPGHRRHLGADTYDIVWTSRYLSIPWGSDLPETVTAAEHAQPDRRADIGSFPTVWAMSWHEPAGDQRAMLHAAGMRWRLGRIMGARGPELAYPVLATAHDDTDRLIHRFELGPGTVVTARPIDGDSAVGVAVRRSGPSQPVDLLSIRPDNNGEFAMLLAADTVDITDRCWPLQPQPIESESYVHRVLATNNSLEAYWTGEDGVQPLVDGMSAVSTTLDGQWPDTHLVWTFRWPQRDGLTLRRRVPLYDELGRSVPPENASIALMEDLATRAIPPSSASHDGILDM